MSEKGSHFPLSGFALSFIPSPPVASQPFMRDGSKITPPFTASDGYRYLILNCFWRNNDSSPPLKVTYCSPQYIQTMPLSHIATPSRKMTVQSLPGPSAGVPKMAITVFTKTPAEHFEEWMWPTLYGPGVFSPEYWRNIMKKLRSGQNFPEWALPDPPPG